jgi:hypothetical protein
MFSMKCCKSNNNLAYYIPWKKWRKCVELYLLKSWQRKKVDGWCRKTSRFGIKCGTMNTSGQIWTLQPKISIDLGPYRLFRWEKEFRCIRMKMCSKNFNYWAGE